MLYIIYFVFVLLCNLIHIPMFQLIERDYLLNILVYKKMVYHVAHKNFLDNFLNKFFLKQVHIYKQEFHYKILYIHFYYKLIYHKAHHILIFLYKNIYLYFHYNNDKMSIFDNNLYHI